MEKKKEIQKIVKEIDSLLAILPESGISTLDEDGKEVLDVLIDFRNELKKQAI